MTSDEVHIVYGMPNTDLMIFQDRDVAEEFAAQWGDYATVKSRIPISRELAERDGLLGDRS